VEEVLRKLEASGTLRTFLRTRAPDADGVGCSLCRMTLEDLEKNGRLTGWPKDALGSGTFPVEGKILHLAVELDVGVLIDDEVAGMLVHDLVPLILGKLKETTR
jgi:hypothetical protein